MQNQIEARSDVLKVHAELRWTIEGILERLQTAVLNERWVSPELVVSNAAPWPGSQKEYTFKLLIFPKGDGEGNTEHVSFYLESHSGVDILVSFKMFLQIKACGSKIALLNGTNLFKGNKVVGNGWPKFYPRAKLDANTELVVSAGAVTFGCDIDIIIPRDYVVGRTVGTKSDEKLPILGQKLFSAMKDNDFTDLTLVCGERRFPCHKLLLSAQSDVFRDMFKLAKRNGDGEENLAIDDIEPDVLEKMLEFVYTEHVADPSENARDLFVAADKFNIPGLRRLTGNFLVASLDAANVAEIIMLFDVHGGKEEDDLITAACRFAAKNVAAVIKTNAWARFVDSHQKAVAKVFEAVAHFQGGGGGRA